jgi:hypothetical protein
MAVRVDIEQGCIRPLMIEYRQGAGDRLCRPEYGAPMPLEQTLEHHGSTTRTHRPRRSSPDLPRTADLQAVATPAGIPLHKSNRQKRNSVPLCLPVHSWRRARSAAGRKRGRRQPPRSCAVPSCTKLTHPPEQHLTATSGKVEVAVDHSPVARHRR